MRYLAGVIMAGLMVLILVATAEGQAEGSSTKASPGAIALFNGKDLSGWKLFIPDEGVDPKTVWLVRDGVVHCTGKPNGYMRTEKEYRNYRLRFEWRWAAEPGNSGLLMHISGPDEVWPKSIEGQLKAGNAGDFYLFGGTDFKEHVDKSTRRQPKKHESNERPQGRWNTYEAVCQANTIRLYINGLLQNEATETTVDRGYIGLQSEGVPIEFRNIVLEPLSGRSEGNS